MCSNQQWIRITVAPHPLQSLVLLVFWDFGYSNRYLVACICYCNLQFPNNVEHFSYTCLPSVSSLCGVCLGLLLILKTRLFIFLLLSFKSLLCIWIIILYQICLSQIFPPSLWLVFSFSCQCFFTGQKFLILMKSSY